VPNASFGTSPFLRAVGFAAGNRNEFFAEVRAQGRPAMAAFLTSSAKHDAWSEYRPYGVRGDQMIKKIFEIFWLIVSLVIVGAAIAIALYYGETILLIVLFVAVPCTLIATLKLSLEGWIEFPENRIFEVVSNPHWLFSLLIFLPWMLGAFARGETSPWPWVAFYDDYNKHGFWSAAGLASNITIVDLWLFWTPAQLYNAEHLKDPLIQRRLVRLVNFLIGLLLITKGNIFYSLLDSIHPSEPDY
jgi:hypothetical protein